MKYIVPTALLGLAGTLLATAGTLKAPSDCPSFGGSPSRNMVNLIDKNVPTEWNVEEGTRKNIKWVADLGNKSYGGPVIAGGKIYVGTNNANPRDKKIKGYKANLMAFTEKDGKYLWQIVHDIPADDIFKDALTQGLCSTPVVEGDRLWYVTPACELICADTDGKVQWSLDMMKELKVVPYHLGNCSPLVVGDLVMVVTSNGVSDEEAKVVSPKSPSFLGVNKKTGKVVWQNNMPGEKIIEGQWSNPTLAVVNGKQQVIFPGGDAFLYALEPETGKLIWKFNCNPRKENKEERYTPNYMVATPVFVDNKIYIGLGVYPEHPSSPPFSYFLCVDATKQGDVSPKSMDAKAPENKDSALVWSYGGPIMPRPERGRSVRFGRTMSTAAVHDGLVYAAEENGYLHCLDAKTGQPYWVHDLKSGVWGSPYYVDGKVYQGTEDGEIIIFEHGKKEKILAKGDMQDLVQSTPVVANGVLYITTKDKLYAIAK